MNNNLEDVLSQLLSSEDGKSSLEDLLKMLNSPDSNEKKHPEPQNEENDENRSDEENHEYYSKSENKSDGDGDDFFGGINFDAIMGLGAMFSQMNKPDKNTALLLALKPHLREENQRKIDSAVKLFKLFSMLPLLKESGLFDNLF